MYVQLVLNCQLCQNLRGGSGKRGGSKLLNGVNPEKTEQRSTKVLLSFICLFTLVLSCRRRPLEHHGRPRSRPSWIGNRDHGSQWLRQIDRRGDARPSSRMQLCRGGRLPLSRKQSKDEQGHPSHRRRPLPVAGVPPRRHQGAAGPWRGRRRQLLGVAAQVQRDPSGRRQQLQSRGVCSLQGEVRVPRGVSGGDRREGKEEGKGRGSLHASEPAAEPAGPAADRRGRGHHHGRRHSARRHHRRNHSCSVQG